MSQEGINTAASASNQKINNKQKTQYQIDVDLDFGQDGGQQTLSQITLKSFTNVSTNILQKQKQLLKQIQFNEEVNNDCLMVLRFQVQIGRQRQGLEFIEKGLDQAKEKRISALQSLFRRPKTSGRMYLKQGKGQIFVIYRFYQQKFLQYVQEYDLMSKSNFDIDFDMNIIMKGSSETNKCHFTSVKPDYVNIQIKSNNINLKSFLSFLQSKEQQPIPQQITEQQIYKLLKNLQTVRLKMKFNSLRKMNEYRNRIFQDQKLNQKSRQRQLPLSNKGIFKDTVNLNIIIGDKIAIQGSLMYKKQQILLRSVAKFMPVIQKFTQN